MQIVDIIGIACHDFHRSIKSYVICLVIISLMFGVAIMLFDIRDVMPDIIKAQFPPESKSATVELVDASSDLTKSITDIGFDNVVLNLTYDYILQKNIMFQIDSEAFGDSKYKFADVFNKEALSVLCGKVTYAKEKNGTFSQMSALLSKTKLTELSISIGSTLMVYDENTSNTLEIEVIGSFLPPMENGDAEALQCDMIINNAVGEELLKTRGLPTEYIGSALINDIFDYPQYAKKLHKLGVYCYGINYGEIVRVNAEIRQLMMIISSILAVIGFFIIIIFVMQTITKHMSNFGIRLALGIRYGTIVKEVLLIIEFLLLTGVIFSKIISTFLHYAVQKKIESVVSVAISTPSVFSSGVLIIFVAVNIMLILSTFPIRKKIKNINVTKLISE